MNVNLNIASIGESRTPRLGLTRVGYVEGAIGGPDRVLSLCALFPNVQFVGVGRTWPEAPMAGLAAIIVSASASESETVLRRLGQGASGPPVIVALSDSDVSTARRFMQAGAADILLAPISEAALALSLERLLAGGDVQAPRSAAGRVIGLIKAGGGVGATALGVQLAAIIAGRPGGSGGVCYADLDVQFGQASMFLDLSEAMTLAEILEGGGPLDETPLASALALHRTGMRLLAAPRDLMPLEAITPREIDGLVAALKRDFAITFLDLPSAWTAWTNHALQLCDQILLVTNLTVPHATLVKKQLRVMTSQRLDSISTLLICNRVSADQKAILAQKAAEKSIGRDFDMVIPEDRALMNDAIAQGRDLASIRTGTKLEKAIRELAGVIEPVTAAPEVKRAWRWR
jgi:pilus assembly protein CpaE